MEKNDGFKRGNKMSKYIYTDDMQEISGFGEGYEDEK